MCTVDEYSVLTRPDSVHRRQTNYTIYLDISYSQGMKRTMTIQISPAVYLLSPALKISRKN